jgi:hypothetical protein
MLKLFDERYAKSLSNSDVFEIVVAGGKGQVKRQ